MLLNRYHKMDDLKVPQLNYFTMAVKSVPMTFELGLSDMRLTQISKMKTPSFNNVRK